MLWVGIDPGISGAIAIYYGKSKQIEFHDMPVLKIKSGKKTKTQIDGAKVATLLRSFLPNYDVYAGMEKVTSSPQMGVTSSFSFGMGYGQILGILDTLKIPYDLPTPQAWKKTQMAGQGKEKDASVQVVKRRFPQVADQLETARGRLLHGRADALLIALHVRKLHK